MEGIVAMKQSQVHILNAEGERESFGCTDMYVYVYNPLSSYARINCWPNQ